jgi:hypothetical protein
MSISVPAEHSCLSSKIIPAERVRVHDAHKAHTMAGADRRPKEPKITLIKDGDTVRCIEVECTCGEIIRLDCEY